MATAPTFVADYSTGFSATTSPRTVSVTVGVDDLLAVMGGSEDGSLPLTTPSGGGLTYTLQQSVTSIANFASVFEWTAPSSSSQTYTLSQGFTGGGTHLFGSDALRFSGSDGVGASAKTNVTSGAPSLDITTTQDNSAICVITIDWNAGDGTSRTWRTVNGITPSAGNGYERVYFRDATRATVYVAYYPDAGAAGTKTVGMTAPTGQKYSIVAVEIKGAASSGLASGLVAGPYTGPAPGRISPTGQWRTQALDPGLAVATSASAESTAANGSAFDAQVGAGANADQTTGTGAANDASIAATVNADQTSATGTANDAAAAIAVNAENTAATGTAFDATVSTAAFTNANAENAAGTAAANNASVAIAVNAEATSATGAAFDATIAVTIAAGFAAGAGQALDAQVGAGGQADVAAATGTASAESLAIQANAEAAAALGAAIDPTVVTGGPGNANAGNAAATGTAYNARVRKLILRPNTGTTARPNTGTTVRPATGITLRPNAGITPRPDTGITERP